MSLAHTVAQDEIDMALDPRTIGARFYDLQPFPNDVPFYRSLIGDSRPSLLELGCGTGRVMLGVADLCTSVHGIEISDAMLEVARKKPSKDATFIEGDISRFDLGRTFDLIVAPYRVFQALESDSQVEGLLSRVRDHLAPGGSCVITMFHPWYDPDKLRERWGSGTETVSWECEIDGERIVATDGRTGMDHERLILYPEQVFRRYRGDELIEELVMPIVMRCWYPKQIEALLLENGFRTTGTWGGYAGETFGEGAELIIRFEDFA